MASRRRRQWVWAILGVLLVAAAWIVRTAVVVEAGDGTTTATLKPDQNVGVGFESLPQGIPKVIVKLRPQDGMTIDPDPPQPFDTSGKLIWTHEILTDPVEEKGWLQWTGTGAGLPNSGAYARFEGKLYGSGDPGPGGNPPEYKASVATVDIDVDCYSQVNHNGDHWTPYADDSAEGRAEDAGEDGPSGGLRVPCLYDDTSFPATIDRNSNDPSYKLLRLNLKTAWGGSSSLSRVGTLRFDISGPGVALYRFGPAGQSTLCMTSTSSAAERTIDVPPGGIAGEDFGILTNNEFSTAQSIGATFTWDTGIAAGAYSAEDTSADYVKLEPTTFYVDLHMDSDGTTDDCDYPDFSKDDCGAYEDSVEEQFEGHAVLISCVDSNLNSIPDFADGMAPGQENACPAFSPMVLELKNTDGMNMSNCRIRFRYVRNGSAEPDAGSDPAAIPPPTAEPNDPIFPWRYIPAPGKLRVWKKDGPQVRNPADAAVGGDYVAIDTWYTCSDLYLAGNSAKLYLEAVNEDLCSESGSEVGEMLVEVSPDGSLDPSTVMKDTVRVSFHKMYTSSQSRATPD